MAVSGFESILSEHPFFTSLDPSQIATLGGCARNARFDAGEYLVREGEPADCFYLLRFGRAALEIATPTAGSITLETVEAGEVLGWSWLFPPFKWHFDARAVTLVRAVSLDGVCLRKKCGEDARLGLALMTRFAQVAIQRLEAAQLQLLDLYAGGR